MASGQLINFDKSTLKFWENTDVVERAIFDLTATVEMKNDAK